MTTCLPLGSAVTLSPISRRRASRCAAAGFISPSRTASASAEPPFPSSSRRRAEDAGDHANDPMLVVPILDVSSSGGMDAVTGSARNRRPARPGRRWSRQPVAVPAVLAGQRRWLRRPAHRSRLGVRSWVSLCSAPSFRYGPERSASVPSRGSKGGQTWAVDITGCCWY